MVEVEWAETYEGKLIIFKANGVVIYGQETDIKTEKGS